MCASGYGDRSRGALHWLETNGPAWAAKSGPAAYAQLIFAAHTAGVDPHHFGGVDLLARLEATGPPAGPKPTPTPQGTTPPPTPTTSPSPTPSEAALNPAAVSPAADADDSPVLSGGAVWWTSIALIVLIAVGVVVVNRRSARNRPRD
jgi:hypothetical protein